MTKLYDDSTASSTGSVQVIDNLGLLGPGPDYQSFRTGSTAVTLTSLAFDLSDANPGDGGEVTVTLYSDNGSDTAPNAALSTLGTIADSSLAATASFKTLAVSSTYTLAANTNYWIQLSTAGGADWYYTSTANALVGGTGTSGQSFYTGGADNTAEQGLMTVNATSLCFAAGTLVLTSHGEIPVEALREGDLIVGLQGGRLRPVRWVGHRNVNLCTHPDPDSINPVRVCANAFGPGQPHRDLILSPNHALYVDGHLIAVRYLLNGATIRQEHWDDITYYHVELDGHDVMLVDGMTAESFLDIGNRAAFSNGGEPVMLHPDFARQTWEAEACAPDLPKGEELTQLRAALLERAAALGHALTDDPDLCVVAGKRRIRPIETAEGFRFNLPKGTRTVQIESRRFKPNEIRAEGNDARSLGVGVLGLALDNTQIPLDDARLTSGWHDPEPVLRWTTGAASLKTQGARTLTIRLFRGHHYWVSADLAQDAHAAA